MLSVFINRLPAAWKAGLMQITYPLYEKFGVRLEMEQVYRELGVGRTSALNAARLLSARLEGPPDSLKDERKRNRELERQLQLKSFHTDVLIHLAANPQAWSKGNERHQFTDEFKIFILRKKSAYDLQWYEVSDLLGIPEETLKRFKQQIEEKNRSGGDDDWAPGRRLPEEMVEKIRGFFQARSGKATVKGFVQSNPEVLDQLEMSYKEFASFLLQLGFTSPKGIFLVNHGLDQIVRFTPHAVWGTDGKQMQVIVNGEIFRFVWQCLIDYKSTVLVGGLIGESETSENLLEAIIRSKVRVGVNPMAMVIDGRLSENLPAIRKYLDEMGIEIIRTFPGNPKSNGIIEGNFNIFEKWIGGKVIVNGDTATELSRSIAQMLTEVFTQLRNHQSRKGLGQKSATEASEQTAKLTPEEEQTIRAKIHALATRLRNEQAVPLISEEKDQAIKQAITVVKPTDPEVFKKRLQPSLYTANLILDAIAIFKSQSTKYPEKKFDHTYYGGILRNLVNQRSVELLYTELESVYTEHWARMMNTMSESHMSAEAHEQMCERLSQEYLQAKIPAHAWITLSHILSAVLLATRGSIERMRTLRTRLAELVSRSKLSSVERRERILRKLFECETYIRKMSLTTTASINVTHATPIA